MNPEINRQADQHGNEGDSQDIEVTHDQRRVAHGIAQPQNQAESRFQWTTRFLIPEYKNQGDKNERNARGLD